MTGVQTCALPIYEGKALVIVRNCKLVLPPATASDHETNAALNGDCELDWLTAHRPGGKE